MYSVATRSAQRDPRLQVVGHLTFNIAFAATTLRNECPVCRTERDSWKFADSNGNDPRFQDDKFARAPAFFCCES